MKSKLKIILTLIIVLLSSGYYYFDRTEDKIYCKYYSPNKQYSIYAKRYKYYYELKLNFPFSKSSDAPAKVFLYDETNKKTIKTTSISMIGNLDDVEWHKYYVSNKGELYIELPKDID